MSQRLVADTLSAHTITTALRTIDCVAARFPGVDASIDPCLLDDGSIRVIVRPAEPNDHGNVESEAIINPGWSAFRIGYEVGRSVGAVLMARKTDAA